MLQLWIPNTVASTSLYKAENQASDFVSFSTSDERYPNFDPHSLTALIRRWNMDDPILHCVTFAMLTILLRSVKLFPSSLCIPWSNNFVNPRRDLAKFNGIIKGEVLELTDDQIKHDWWKDGSNCGIKVRKSYIDEYKWKRWNNNMWTNKKDIAISIH